METFAQPLTKWPESKMLIRFSDCDLYGHLNNIWYLKYFLDAREDHIADNYGLTLGNFAKLGVGWVVGSNQISYVKPAKVNEQVILRSAVVNFNASQLLIEMQMLNVQRTHLKAVMWSRLVHVGLHDGKRIEHNESLTGLFGQIKLGGYEEWDFDQRVNDLKIEFGK